MKNRRRLNKKHSRRLFSNTARRTHKKNIAGNPMRGGIRL